MNKPQLTIGLGYEGPTDSCLTLSDEETTKEFGIEGDSWRILSRIAWKRTRFTRYPIIIWPDEPEYKELRELLDKDTREDEV